MSMLFFLKPFHQFYDRFVPEPELTAAPVEDKKTEEKELRLKRKRVYQIKKNRREAVAKELDTVREARRFLENTIRQEAIARFVQKRRNQERDILAINDMLDRLDELDGGLHT